MQEKDLKDQLSATRRLLQLASEKRKALQRRVSLLREMNNPGVGREPFFYSAIDSDEEPGIVISQDFDPSNFLGSDNRQRFTGFIKINDDAPFIWTHVGVALRLLRAPRARTSRSRSVRGRRSRRVFQTTVSS